MAAEVSLPVWLLCDPLRGRQGVAGFGAVSLGGEVAHGLEGIAPVAEVLDPFGQAFEFAGLDLGAAQVQRLDRGIDKIAPRVDRVLDLGWLHEEVADCYCPGNGRPGIGLVYL